jgi:hypothetical protein
MSADLDKAIDRAVREMLDVEPPTDLRARVVARIDAPPVAGFQWPVSSFQRFAALAIAAALLVLVVTFARRSEPPAQPRVVANGGGQQQRGKAMPQPPIDVLVTQQRVATTARNTGARVPAGVAHAASIDAADAASAIDPLKTIAPIDVAPIAQSSIAPEPIAMRPLNPITEMQVAPLTPPDRRN